MVIPTLAADSRLLECVASLSRQTRRDFEVVIVDNSGQGLVRRNLTGPGARIIENARTCGLQFGVWTVDRVADMQRLIEAGVDGICTDRPDRLARMLRRSTQGGG